MGSKEEGQWPGLDATETCHESWPSCFPPSASDAASLCVSTLADEFKDSDLGTSRRRGGWLFLTLTNLF